MFECLVLPVIKKSIQNKTYGLALGVAKLTSFSYAQQPHTDEQTALCWRVYLDDFLQAGRDIAQNLSPLVVHPQSILKIGIVIDSVFNNCSPVTVLFETFKDIRKLAHPIVITIYAYNSIPEDDKFLVEKFQNIGVEVVDIAKLRDGLCPELDSASERILMLRELMLEHAIQLAIYTHSTPAFIAFAATVGLAPVQVSMSMGGYYTLHIPEVQGYIAFGLFEESKVIGGHKWNVFPLRSGKNFQVSNMPALIELAHHIRHGELGNYKTVIGCIGRAQKIDSDEFMDVLESILRAKPDCVFLWFGKEESLSVKEKMQTRGILEQCIFQGWADINVYARVLDIQIDSFPFPLGIATLQCMSAGTPCVHYFSQEPIETITRYVFLALNDQSGTLDERSSLKKLFINDVGQTLFLGATNTTKYVEFVHMLIDDVQFRVEVGNAGRNFMNSFMCDDLATAEGFTKVLTDLYNNHKQVFPKIQNNKQQGVNLWHI